MNSGWTTAVPAWQTSHSARHYRRRCAPRLQRSRRRTTARLRADRPAHAAVPRELGSNQYM